MHAPDVNDTSAHAAVPGRRRRNSPPARIRRARSSNAAFGDSTRGSRRSAPSSISTSRARARPPTRAPSAGAPASRCRRSTACRSASRTSSRRPTCRPRWARRCSPAGAPERTPPASRRCAQAGAVILGKTVTTEFAATEPRGTRNPWDLDAHAGRLVSSGSAAAVAAGMISAALGTQVIGSTIRPASFCGCVRLQADGRRAQPRRQPRLPEPELHRRSRRDAGGCLAGRLRDRAARRRRSGLSGPGRAAPCAAGSQAAAARLSGNVGLASGQPGGETGSPGINGTFVA